jgi:holo-[acyl-carrier protein] synthase
MVDGIGIDIIETARIARAIQNPRFLARVFTPHEAADCRSRGRAAERFAGRFAAKEAIAKALGVPLTWQELEIRNGPHGKPHVLLSGAARARLGPRRLLLSISHCHAYAVAQAVVLSGNDEDPLQRLEEG